jgi:O-antigen/teichoic acid export membrane protein
LRLALCLVAVVIAEIAFLLLHASGTVQAAGLVASSQFVAEALLTVCVVFHVALRQQHEAFVRLAANVVKLIVVVVLVKLGAGLVPVVGATTVTLLVASLLAWIIATRRYGLRPRWDGARARGLMQAAAPVGPAMLVGALYLKLDAVMVAWLGTRAGLAEYGAAYQPIEYLFLASAIVVMVTFPLVARTQGRDHREFTRVYQRGTELIIAVVLPVSIVLAVCAQPLTELAYPPEYRGAALSMSLLAISLVLMSLNVWQGLVLLAADRQYINFLYLVTAVVLNILLDIFFIPQFGPSGAAWGTLNSATFLFACSTIAVVRFADGRLSLSRLARIAVVGLVVVFILTGLRAIGVNWIIAAGVAAVTYPLWLASAGIFSWSDVRDLMRREQAEPRELTVGAMP